MLSAIVITYMEEAKIGRCLDSLSFCDECVVVDSGSTDGTVAIAQAKGARVIQQAWLGFGPQKQFAVAQACHDWVLCVDADEVVSETLRDAILAELQNPQTFAYRMARSNFIMGRFLRHGEGYPDWSLRLFHRNHASWSADQIHEKVITDASIGTLVGDIEHRTADNLERYLARQNRYTSLQAEQLLAAGKSGSLFKVFLSPLVRFIKFYFVRLGFLDGFPGFLHIWIGCTNSFIKHAKVREARIAAKLSRGVVHPKQ